MGDTFHSSAGARTSNRHALVMHWPLVLLGVTALGCSTLAIWAGHTTWDKLDRFEKEFLELKVESFYLGARTRSRIQGLNDTLLRYRLRGDPSDADQFRREADDTRTWLASSQTNVGTVLERRFFTEIGAAYGDYEGECLKLLAASRGFLESTKAKEFKASYEKVQNQSQHLLERCDRFVSEQRAAFEGFLEQSQQTLVSFRWLLELSLVLVLSLASALLVLIYRGLIAPLRHRLTESQAIIARQEKLASLGSLAAGVAHEIRNPLTAIKVRLFSLKRTLAASNLDNEDTTVISGEISRLERIVKDFLRFARPSEPELVDVPVSRILNEVQDLLRPPLEKAAIELRIENDSPHWIRADTAQLKQVLINLVQNAADSVGRNGVILLRSRFGLAPGRKSAGTRVLIEVTDNGKGIPPEVQKRLFDPFFTTKEGGTGLGLPIAARIVEKHGGELRYETELNRGTTFRIVLPRVPEHES
jgi:signal transduction histidine kinase